LAVSDPVRRQWRPGNVPVPEAHVAGLAAGLLLHRLRPWRRPAHPVAGWAAAGAGAYVIARAVQAAGSVDLARPGRLVTAFPYSASRNPMYVGWALLHLGAGLITGSGWILGTLPAAAAWVHLDVRREERRLAAALGPEYRRYRAAVPRYLGRAPAGS
jgi:protein-S-isoprenylcysteine O-methyltransferase Ste14